MSISKLKLVALVFKAVMYSSFTLSFCLIVIGLYGYALSTTVVVQTEVMGNSPYASVLATIEAYRTISFGLGCFLLYPGLYFKKSVKINETQSTD